MPTTEFDKAICEQDLENGRSPNPYVKASPFAAMAECYAATNFLPRLIEALPAPPLVTVRKG